MRCNEQFGVGARLLALVAAALLWCTGGAAHAQVREAGSSTYDFASFVQDVEHSGAKIPIAKLADVYEAHMKEMEGQRQALTGARIKYYETVKPGFPDKHEAIESAEAFRTAFRNTEAGEDRLFEALRAVAPADVHANLRDARVARANRQLCEAIERIGMLSAVRSFDLENAALGWARDDAARTAVRHALAKSAPELRDARTKLLEAQLKSLLVLATSAEAAGLCHIDPYAAWREAAEKQELEEDAREDAKKHEPPNTATEGDAAEVEDAATEVWNRFQRVTSAASASLWRQELDVLKAQWHAIVDASAVLPRAQGTRFMVHAAASSFPRLNVWDEREDELISILRWKGAPTGCPAKVRAAILRWREADDALMRVAIGKYLTALSARDHMPGDDEEFFDEAAILHEPRERAWTAFKEEVKACIPTEESIPAPEGEEEQAVADAEYEEIRKEVFDLMGFPPQVEPVEDDGNEESDSGEFDESASGLPSKSRLKKILIGLECPEELLAVAEQIRADAASAWETTVSPVWEQARSYEFGDTFRSREMMVTAVVVEASARGFESAFTVMERAQGALAESLVTGLGTHAPPVEALRLALQLRDPGGWSHLSWRAEGSYNGGSRVNPFEAMAFAKLPEADRKLAMAAFMEAESELRLAQRSCRRAAIAFTLAEDSSRRTDAPASATRAERRKFWEAQRENAERTEQALIASVHAARAVAESVIERMCAALPPKSAEALRAEALMCGWQEFYEPQKLGKEAVDELTERSADPADMGPKLKRVLDGSDASMTPTRESLIEHYKSARGTSPMSQYSPRMNEAQQRQWRIRQVKLEETWFRWTQQQQLLVGRMIGAVGRENAVKSRTMLDMMLSHGFSVR